MKLKNGNGAQGCTYEDISKTTFSPMYFCKYIFHYFRFSFHMCITKYETTMYTLMPPRVGQYHKKLHSLQRKGLIQISPQKSKPIVLDWYSILMQYLYHPITQRKNTYKAFETKLSSGKEIYRERVCKWRMGTIPIDWYRHGEIFTPGHGIHAKCSIVWATGARHLLFHAFEYWLWRYKSSLGRDIFCLKNSDAFSGRSVREYCPHAVDIYTGNIWNVNCVWTTTYNFDTRTDVLVKVSKFVRLKMSRPEGDSRARLLLSHVFEYWRWR